MTKRFFVLLLLLYGQTTAAQILFPDLSDNKKINLTGYAKRYIDYTGQLQFEELLSSRVKWSRVFPKPLFSPGGRSILWLHVDIDNPSSASYYRYMAFGNPLTDVIDVYLVRSATVVAHFMAGEALPFSARPIENRNFIVPVTLHANDTLQVYIRIQDGGVAAVPVSLVHPDLFVIEDQKVVAVLALYSGFLAVILVYFFVIYGVTRQIEFFIYSLFVLLSTLFVMTQHGITFQYLWPNITAWNMISDPVLLMLTAATGYWFLRDFLNLKESMPFLYRVISLLIIVQGFFVVAFLISKAHIFFNATINLLVPGVLVSLFVVLKLAYRGDTSARYFSLAWLFLSVGILVQVFANQGYIERTLLNDNGFMLGNVFYVLILSFALAFRVQAIESERISALSLSHAKSEFLAKMSHELRTPIHGVLGLVELLIDTPMSKFQKRYIHLIDTTGKSLLSIVNDLLDYSKIEAGQMSLTEVNFNLDELLEEITPIFSYRLHSNEVQLKIETTGLSRKDFHGDREKLKQIIVNLLSNAFKFTQTGLVTIVISEIENEESCYQFQVIDSGSGIPSEDLENLFDAFYQAKQLKYGNQKGTGLGLSICKQLAGIMGGDISVKSVVGKGTCFELRIPLSISIDKQVDLSDLSMSQDAQKKHLNVLLAEDNMTNQIVMQGMLKKLGHNLTLVENGQDALQILETRSQEFDLVFMDYDMPVMGGLEATRRIRTLGSSSRVIKIIAMTAHTSNEIKNECIAAGMTDFLSKPICLAQLSKKIDELM